MLHMALVAMRHTYTHSQTTQGLAKAALVATARELWHIMQNVNLGTLRASADPPGY
jgi:hypothetical protein